jgi:chloramphenicol-sensitive protein RarD
LSDCNNELRGAAFIAASYALWGILPVYWKVLDHVPAPQVLGHRIIWSVVFLALLMVAGGRWGRFRYELKEISQQPKKILGIILAAITLNINWFIYIWAIINDHVIQTSLGYYINPLVSVVFGLLVLKEKMNVWQYAAFFLALAAVINLGWHFGSIPWISLSLAVTFALYGLIKKMVGAGAITGLTLETMVTVIPALIYILYMQQTGQGALSVYSPLTSLLLVGAGVVTAVPLLLFSYGTLNLSLVIAGFFQYISPTLTLLLGIFVYHEKFTPTHLISFSLIWMGLAIFTLSQIRLLRPGWKKAFHNTTA